MKARFKSILNFSIIFVFLLNRFLAAQISIDGTIGDSDQNGIKNVLVEIIDKNNPNKNYRSLTDASGYFNISVITDVDENIPGFPNNFLILRNYPNPFNPTTIIYFEMPIAGKMEIAIYDILGRKIRSLYNNFHKKGVDQLIWDGRNNANQPVSAGVYLCQMKTKDQIKVHKMVLLDGGSNTASIRYNKLTKSYTHNTSNVNRIFNFTLKISGDSVLDIEFKNLRCTQDTSLNIIVSKLQKEVSIGSEGGSLATEDFELIAPVNAFSQSSNLKLYIEPDNRRFGEFSASKYFSVTGIPRDFHEALSVKLKNNEPLSGINFIAVGLEDTVQIFDSSFVDITFDLYDTEESEGFLTCEIPTFKIPSSEINKRNIDDEAFRFFFGLITKGDKWNPFEDHFEIKGTIPQGERVRADEIVSFFEQAYQRFKNAGFIYSHNKWPMKIEFVPDNKNPLFQNFVTTSVDEYHYGVDIVFDKSLKNPLFFRGKVDSDFLHNLFKTYSEFNQSLIRDIKSWASFKFGYTWAPEPFLKIIHKSWIKSYSTKHVALLIDYIGIKYGDQKVWEVLEKDFTTQNLDLTKTLVTLFGNPIYWLSEYYTHLMTYNKFSLLDNSFWIDNCHHKKTIDNNRVEFPDDYKDLSSKWHHLELADNFDESKTLKLSTYDNSNATISVLKYKNNEREVITNGISVVTVSDIQKLAAEGYDLFVIVTNNEYTEPDYKSTKKITLTIESIDKPKITGVSILLSPMRGTLLRNGFEFLPNWHFDIYFAKEVDTAKVTFENNTLIQEYENHVNSLGGTFTQRIEIVFNDKLDVILNFNAHSVTKRKGTVDYYTVTSNLSAQNIPIYGNYNNYPWLNYKSSGPIVCDQITSISWLKENSNDIQSLGDYRCIEGTDIDIYIEREY